MVSTRRPGSCRAVAHGSARSKEEPEWRGQARRPLYVTAIGIPDIQAAAIVEQMSGPYRLPDALRRVDALTRGSSAASPAASQR